MNVVVDAIIPIDEKLLPERVSLIRVEGRSLTSQQLQDASALIVRSITQVNAELLTGTSVEFVGTATSGTDHLDIEFLNEQGITWLDAAGSNADAVVDYCLASLAHWQLSKGVDIRDLKIGIVGVGQVGSRLANRLQQLGCRVLLNDPPLDAAGTSSFEFVSLERIAQCPIVSLHVPYTAQAPNPTHNLIAAEFLKAMPEQALLINSCRGGVVDENALREHLQENQHFSAVVDVWQNEPAVDATLVDKVMLATPHIAGYSLKAKQSAANRMLEGLFEFIGESSAGLFSELNASSSESLDVSRSSNVWEGVLQAVPIVEWSNRFKNLAASGSSRDGFDLMRKELQARKELSEFSLDANLFSAEQSAALSAMGFDLGS